MMAVDVFLSITRTPSQHTFHCSPSRSSQTGTVMRKCLNKRSLPSSNTRQTCSTVPLPGCPRDWLNRMQNLLKSPQHLSAQGKPLARLSVH